MLVQSGKSVFLSGKAGTGKSYISKELMLYLDKIGVKYIAIAPTGVAANNIGGATIHSTFSIPPFGVLDYESCNRIRGEKRRLLNSVKVIIIDEVSMLRPDILDAMHWTLIKNGCDGLNTKQIIFIGDMKQLPPVLDDNERAVLLRTYDGDTFNYAKIYSKINPDLIELDEVVRQSDAEFIGALNIIREGGRHEYFKRFVHNEPNGIILAPHNSTVQRYNEQGLNNQKGDMFTLTAQIEGNVKADDFNLETIIKVKTGCKIMYLVNSKDNPLVNGTLGVFIAHNDCYYIRVNDTDFALNPVMFSKKKYVYNEQTDAIELQELGSISQYPFKLAYALSIHKSQGLTFDEMTLDLSRPCFQKGQMYVGLSRVRTPEGLRIKL